MKQNNFADNANRLDIPQTTKVVKIDIHNENFVTVWLKGSISITPGQFIMVWLPGIEEKPFAVTLIEKDMFAFTAMRRGKFTSALFTLKPGEVIGYRGPYGNGFTLVENKSVCIVASGIGIAALSLLYSELKHKLNNKVTLIYGAKTCNDLIFKHIKPDYGCDCNLHLCTDDGSEGRKAFTTQLLEQELSNELDKIRFDIVYTCGPEIMMKKVVDICAKHNIPCEASLERFMCCGFGVCGKCAINDRLVCADGPVFTKEELARLPDFGRHECKCKE